MGQYYDHYSSDYREIIFKSLVRYFTFGSIGAARVEFDFLIRLTLRKRDIFARVYRSFTFKICELPAVPIRYRIFDFWERELGRERVDSAGIMF